MNDGWTFLTRGDRPAAGAPGSSLLEFDRQETDITYELSFRWLDYHKRVQSLRVSLPREVLRGEEALFGCDQGEIADLLEHEANRLREEGRVALRDFADRLITANRWDNCVSLKEDEERNMVLETLTQSTGEMSRARAAVKELSTKIGKERQRLGSEATSFLEKRRRDYLVARGLRVRGDKKIEVDYRRCVARSLPAMREIARAIQQGADRPTERLERILSFVQSLEYALPPIVENGKNIVGFWVPSRVLVDGRGDCDSKAILFATLWLSVEKEMLALIKVPGHVLLGVANTAGGGRCLVYRGIEFNLIEVSGGALMFPPGTVSEAAYQDLTSGRFEVEILN